MKKFLVILCSVFFYSAAQGQINLNPKANEAELTTLKNEFQELYKQRNTAAAVEKGVKVAEILVEAHNLKEVASLLYQMDQMIIENEKETKKTNFRLRFMLANQRLRMYISEGKSESSKTQFNLMHYCMTHLKDEDTLKDHMLLTNAEYYYTFGQASRSLEAYKELLRRCVTSNDEQNREACYKNMLTYAERKKIAPLTGVVQNLYTVWQDSIHMIKAARELEILKQEHTVLQQNLDEKEQTISSNKLVTIGLWVIIIALAAVGFVLLLLLFKSIYQVKKLKKSLKIANESNAQKSHFISNINTQISPTLEVMEEAGGSLDVQTIAHSIVALKRRIVDMQTYISLEETREEAYGVSSLDVKLLCETVMEKVSPGFHSGVESVVTAPRVSMKTNAEALEYVLSYLLSHASSNTETGKISLEFKKRNARTGQFIITDTGLIVEPEMQEALFKPFAETEPLAQENGWGLPICRLMAYKLNGTLKVDSEYKKGTRFILDLHS